MFVLFSLHQQNQEHDAHPQAETQELARTQTHALRLHHLLPHLGSDIDEVASHKGQKVSLYLLTYLAQTQTQENAQKTHTTDHGVAHYRLANTETALQQQTHVAHQSWNFVSIDCDEQGHVGILFPQGETDSEGKSIEEDAGDLGNYGQVARRVFALEGAAAGVLSLFLGGRP